MSSWSDSDSHVNEELGSPSPKPWAFSDEEAMSMVATVAGRKKKRAGRTEVRDMRHPVYWVVCRRNCGKWVCEVREPNKKTRIWLGTFPSRRWPPPRISPCGRGASTCLNFPDSASNMPAQESGSAWDIWLAAAKAAEAFRPSEYEDGGEGRPASGVSRCGPRSGKMGPQLRGRLKWAQGIVAP